MKGILPISQEIKSSIKAGENIDDGFEGFASGFGGLFFPHWLFFFLDVTKIKDYLLTSVKGLWCNG